jgi:hypothetical protein
MKKRLLFLFITIFLPVASLLAQNQETATRTLLPAGSHHPIERSMTKTTACGVDTILYPYLKELTLAAPNDSFFVDAMVGSVRTAAQAYHIAEPISIHGVQFWGGAYSTSAAPQTLTVRAYLYSVLANNQPDSILDSVDIVVTQDYGFYEGAFATPHVWGENFAVAVRSLPNDTLAVITNNAGNVWSPDYSESLAWRRFGSGAWNSAQSFFGQDLEYMIFPIVSYSISASFATDGPTECTGTEAGFTNTSSSILSNRMLNLYAFDEYWGFAAADSTFTWDYSDGSPEENAMEGAHTFTNDSTYDVALTAELVGYYTSCMDTYTSSVEVLATPVAALNVSGTVEFCENGTVALTASPAANVTYEWYMNDTLVADSTAGMFTIAESGDYYVIVDNACGTDTSAIATAVLSVEPVAMLNTSGTIDLCEGELTEFTATPATGVNYQWMLDGAPVADSTFSTYQTSVAGDYSVIASNTCGADTSDVVSVVVNSEPDASLNISGALTFCEGGSVTLTAMPASDVTYEWLMGGTTVSDSTSGTFVVSESGDYTVIASNGCGVDTAVTVTVNVNDLPAVPVIIETGGVLEVDSTNLLPGYLFQWQADGSDIPDATTDTLSPAANGMYTITVTDANGCSNTSEAFEVDYIGQEELTALQIIIAPNPANETFTVSYDARLALRFELYDAQGKRVQVEPVIQGGAVYTALFPVSHLSDGVYLLRGFGSAGTVTERIVVKN